MSIADDIRRAAEFLDGTLMDGCDRRNERHALAARLLAAPDPQKEGGAVAGWVMVPQEATNAMYRAWCRGNVDWRQRYEDMLAAAPPAPGDKK